MFLVGSDPFMGLDFCPGDSPELMKAIDEEMARRLAKCYALLIRKALEKWEERRHKQRLFALLFPDNGENNLC